MAEYRNRTSGEVKTESELRAANKNMSFPKAWNSSVHDALNVDPVLASPAPKPSAEFKVLVRDGVVQDGKGNWVYAWKEQEMFTEYTDDDGNTVTVQAQKDAKASADNAALAAEERSKRNDLLKATDHYGLSDVTMPDAIKTYRQALRDVPQQENFPSTISWPTKP
jgi:hypothetical protein|tara:strand:- start:262 stop:759 length:498 start_codon:yes stop_codon:yes gene_type:complete